MINLAHHGGESRDALFLNYRWSVPKCTIQSFICSKVDHAAEKFHYPWWHDELHNFAASFISEFSHNVATEFPL